MSLNIPDKDPLPEKRIYEDTDHPYHKEALAAHKILVELGLDKYADEHWGPHAWDVTLVGYIEEKKDQPDIVLEATRFLVFSVLNMYLTNEPQYS